MLAGDKPEPGGEIAPAFENLHRRREGLNRQGRNWSDAGHCLQTACRVRACGFVSCHLLKFRDLFRQPLDLIEENARQLHDEKWERRHLILDRPFKNSYMRLSLRGHDAMLGQMTAERVDQLCALPDQKI